MTKESNALDLERGVFTLENPRSIARSLKRSADRSRRRKADPYRSAMSMLTFYINRAGKRLSRTRRARLEAAKSELRTLYAGHVEAPVVGKPRSARDWIYRRLHPLHYRACWSPVVGRS